MYLLRDNLLPFDQNNLVELLQDRALHQPNDTAYIFLTNGENEAISLTYRELDQKARLIGSVLQNLGLRGERALLMYPPGLEFISSFFGCLYAGVIAVPAYPPRRNQSLERLHSIVADCQATQVLSTTTIKKNLGESLDRYPNLETLSWLSTDNLVSSWNNNWEFSPILPDSLAFLQYTSGSTGTPKGVMVSHRNLMQNQQMIEKAFGHNPNTIGAGWLPLFHDMGLIGNVLQPLYFGKFCVLMSPVDFLQKPVRWLQMISQYRANSSGGPNFAYDLCLRKITEEQMQGLDLSSWEVAFTGAEPIRAQTLENFAAKFAPWGFRKEAFYPCYGMAEATLFIAGGRKHQEPITETVDEVALEENRAIRTIAQEKGSKTIVGCGRAWLDEKIVIVNPETLTRCPNHKVGEIWVASASIAQGYWNQPEKTRETFQAYLADTKEGPFLRTGDLGFLREDGELFVTGRLKDVVIIRGKNHYPQDLEHTVQKSHPALQSVPGAAFGVEIAGEEKLVVVQEVERTYLKKINIEEVIGNIRQELIAHHGLQVYEVVLIKPGTLPKTSSGKIQRYLCRARFLERMLDAVELGKGGLIAPEPSRTLEMMLRAV